MSTVVDGNYFHYVKGLMVPRNASFESVDSAINKFIDLVPKITEQLEDDLIERKYLDMKAGLEQLLPLLKNAYACGLETSVARLLRFVYDFDIWKDRLPKATRALISDLNSLSIEMQTGQRFGADKEAKSGAASIEMHADMLKNLAAISELFSDGSQYKATCLVEDMARYTNDATFYELMELGNKLKYKELELAVQKLRETHSAALRKAAGTDLSKKILTVDDMPEILSFVSSALKNHYKVFGTQNGKTAIKIMAAQKPDLFILDIDMPGMDGFELAETIRDSVYHVDTPIIFLTGNSSRERFERAVKLKANDFIVKPATHETLLTKVGKFLNRG